VGAELLRADGWMDRQTDMKKLIVLLRNFLTRLRTVFSISGKAVFHQENTFIAVYWIRTE